MNRRTLFLIGLLVELVAVFGLFLPQQFLLRDGTPVSLKTTPVDPLSVFRGEFVALDYEAAQAPGPVDWTYDETESVYVVLRKNGEFYERSEVTKEIPDLLPTEACIRGIRQYGRVWFPDIAQYFVEEGLGKELEQSRNAHRLIVDAVTDGQCRAGIKGVRLGPEVPQSEFPTAPAFPETKPVPASASGAVR